MDLCALLKSEDERRKLVKLIPDIVPPVQSAACVSNLDRTYNSGNKTDRLHVICWYCGMRGHVQNECRTRKRQDRRAFMGNRIGWEIHEPRNYRMTSRQTQDHRRAFNQAQNQKDDENHWKSQHQRRGFLTRLHVYSASVSCVKSQKSLLDFGVNAHFIWDRQKFETYDVLPKTTVHTCAGVETVFVQGKVQFQMNSSITSLEWKHIPDFSEHVIPLSILLPTYDIHFKNSDEFRGYLVIDRKTDQIVYRGNEQDGLYPFPAPLSLTKRAF